MFTVFDSKAEAYMQPFFSRNNGTATRMFETEVNNPDSDFHRHAEDYSLFRLGVFIQGTAEIQLENVVAIARAIELRRDNEG